MLNTFTDFLSIQGSIVVGGALSRLVISKNKTSCNFVSLTCGYIQAFVLTASELFIPYQNLLQLQRSLLQLRVFCLYSTCCKLSALQ